MRLGRERIRKPRRRVSLGLGPAGVVAKTSRTLEQVCGAMACAFGLTACLTPNPNLPEGEETTGQTSSSTTGAADVTTASSTSATTPGDATTIGNEDSTTVAQTTEDDDSGETTGPAQCGGDSVCVPPVPPGWQGPIVWAETASDDEAPSCPEGYPTPAFTVFDELQAPPAECSCTCGNATGVSCDTITLEYHMNDSNCSGAAQDSWTVGTSCNAQPAEPAGDYWQVQQPGVSGGSCTPSGNTSLPLTRWDVTVTACEGASAAGGVCDGDDLCLNRPPTGFESRVCIWQPGELECPASFDDPFIRYDDVDDSRNCEACSCGSPTGECGGSVILFSSGTCSGAPSGTVLVGGNCVQSVAGQTGSVFSARATNLSVSETECEPSVGTAIGEAEPSDPITLCCMSL